MRTCEPDERWVVQPLLDAGLDLDDVRELMFRVGFEALATAGRSDLWDATVFLGCQPPAVRAAWIETCERMLHPDMSAGDRR